MSLPGGFDNVLECLVISLLVIGDGAGGEIGRGVLVTVID